jgi:hypothetical protein
MNVTSTSASAGNPLSRTIGAPDRLPPDASIFCALAFVLNTAAASNTLSNPTTLKLRIAPAIAPPLMLARPRRA